jgi:biotin carboxylase
MPKSVHEQARKLLQGQRHAVETAYEKALAYVWGRQDAQADVPTDTAVSERFAEAFAQAQLNFITEQHHTMTNLRDAYERWAKGEPIV